MRYGPTKIEYDLEVRRSYSFDTLLADFNNGEGDIFLSLSADNYITHKMFDITIPLLDETVVWVVPKAKRIENWKVILMIFTCSNWIALLIVLAMSVAIFRMFSRKRDGKYHKTLYLAQFTTLIFLSMATSSVLPKNSRMRVFFLFLTFFCINLGAYLQGKLYSNFTQPLYEKEISNIDELLESGLPMMFGDALAILFLLSGPKNMKVFNTYVVRNI